MSRFLGTRRRALLPAVVLRYVDAVALKRREGLDEAQRLAQLGSWSWDPRSERGVWSAEMLRIFGRGPGLGAASREEFLSYVVTEDRPKIATWHATLLAGLTPPELEYRIVGVDGNERVLHALASPDPHHRGSYVGTVQDVTDLRAVERQLLASRQELAAEKARLQAIIDHAPAAIVVRDTKGRYEHVNRLVADALGMTPQEMVGLSPADHAGHEAIVGIRGQDARLISSRVPVVEDLDITHADGSQHVYHVVNYPITDADGRVTALGSFSVDITDRKQTERALRNSERQLGEAQTLAQFGSWELDLHSERMRWSDELCRIFGQPAGFAPTLTEFAELVHPDDRSTFAEGLDETQQTGFSEGNFRIIRPDGEVRHVDARRFGRTDERGVITELWGTTQDVTERATAELEVRRAREHAEAIITAMGEGYALTIDGTIAAVNDSLCTLTGFSREQLVGAGMPFPFWPSDQLAESRRIRERVVNEGGGTFEITLMRADDSRFEAEITAQAARNLDGTLLGFVNTIRDISERKRYEAALERERRNLHEAQAIARVGSWEIDRDTQPEARWSAQSLRMLGIDREGTPPTMDQFFAMVHHLDRERIREAVTEAGRSGQAWDGEFRMLTADGRKLVVSFDVEHVCDDRGRVIRSRGTIQDITDRAQRDAEERGLRRIAELVAANAGSAAVFAAVAAEVQGLFEAHSGLVTRFDESAGVGTVVSGHRADGEPIGELSFDRNGETASARVARTGQPARIDTPPPAGSDPASQWLAANQIIGAVAAPVIVGGRLWGALAAEFNVEAMPADAEERLARFARLMAMAIANAESWDTLSRQASTDAVSGLANQRTFQERLSSEVTRARRYQRHLSLVLLDLDHFKAVNDTFGHQAGDRVLAEVGRRLTEQARDGELVARIGGEEFAWLMPETNSDGAYLAAERLRRLIESEPFPGVGTVTVSAGVCASERGLDGDELLRFADRALYWAKDGGRNATFLYSDDAHALLTLQTRTVEPFQTMSSVRALARAIDLKDVDTREHSERVAALAERLAMHLGWTAKRARLLHDCGLLHDVGKIGIPDEVLLKPGPLSPTEYAQIKQHAELSARIAAEVLEKEQVTWIRGHHERWDGSGYPDHLSADQIPDGAQILAVADAFDVMTQSRTYKPRREIADAMVEFQAQSGTQFAPIVVDALLAMTTMDPATATPPRPTPELIYRARRA